MNVIALAFLKWKKIENYDQVFKVGKKSNIAATREQKCSLLEGRKNSEKEQEMKTFKSVMKCV